jgi:hypothetical protein
MTLDRVQPLKIEDTGTGTETDLFPTAVDKNEDYLDCHGITLQGNSSNDEAVVVARDESGNMTMLDSANTVKTLSDLVALRKLAHFINNGPTEGFASGAYRANTGTALPTAITWYDKAGEGKIKIVEKLITYTGSFPTTVVWKMYDASESLIATITDVITYSGAFETSRIRTIA